VVRVTDQDGNYFDATLTVTPRISITPTESTVGTQITLTGNGFAPGAPVAISWDNAALNPAVSTTASATGTISVTFAAPASARGIHTIKATDTYSNSASVPFTITPKIVLYPATGGYQDTITVTLAGFSANSALASTQISAGGTTYNIETAPTAVTTDANGNAVATFSIPGVYNGNWTVQATDGGGASAQTALAVTQKLTLNATTGAAGDIITVTGTGFAVNKGISFTYNSAPMTTDPSNVASDANGSFSCQFAVPPSVAGGIVLSASDGTNVANRTFTAIAMASVGKVTTETDPGSVGMEMTINGAGFSPGATVTVIFESTPVSVATVTSDANGSFSVTFKTPAVPAGNHTIKATDGITTMEFAFFMDSTAPAAPILLNPIEQAKPKQPVPFTWNPVEDPSGVTYTLQISQDPLFGTLLLEKSGLTAATYSPTALEKLKSAGSKTPYYWRVQATDLAGNVGLWSSTNTFTIGFIWPNWMIHVWYGLGVLGALLLGLWLGRRMAYQSL
jgi:hypothetical protein